MRTDTLINKLDSILAVGIDTLKGASDPYAVLFAIVEHGEMAGSVGFGAFMAFVDSMYSDPQTVADDNEGEPDHTEGAVKYVMHGIGTALFNRATAAGMKLEADSFLSRENRDLIEAKIPRSFGTFRKFEKMATDARKILRGWEADTVTQEQIDAVNAGLYGAKAKALKAASEDDKRTDVRKATDGLVRAYVAILKLTPKQQTKVLRAALNTDSVKKLADTVNITPQV